MYTSMSASLDDDYKRGPEDRNHAKAIKGIGLAMRTTFANWTRLTLVVAVVTASQTGCKSGWKMPGTDLFSWSKKPSESTLAGSSPSLAPPTAPGTGSGAAVSGSPVSPATRNTPNAYASAPKTTAPYNAPTAAMANNRMGTPPGFPAPTGNAAMGSPNGMNGMVASSNGYQTPQGFAPQQGYGVPSANAGLAATNTAAPNFAMPTSLPPSMPNAMVTNNLPPAYGGAVATNNPTAGYAMPPATGTIPAMPAAYTAQAPMPSALPTSMPNAAPSNFPSSQPNMTAPAYAGAAPYKPGSTARSTGYDFSNSAPPAGVPNTASGAPMYR
jgi:hypothetical protein